MTDNPWGKPKMCPLNRGSDNPGPIIFCPVNCSMIDECLALNKTRVPD